MLADIAILTGGSLISDELATKLESVSIEMLGQAKKILIEKDHTTIVGGAGRKSDIEERRLQPREGIKASSTDYDREKLEEGFLDAIGAAVRRVGGSPRKGRADCTRGCGLRRAHIYYGRSPDRREPGGQFP